MKKETKELISWLKEHLSHYRIELATGRVKIGMVAGEKEEERAFAAIDFLNTLPEIELHLCRGGYIQDRNGTPCCDGDKVRFEFEKKGYEENWSNRFNEITTGVLSFSPETKSFAICFGCKGDWIDWTISDYGCKWFEKVLKK